MQDRGLELWTGYFTLLQSLCFQTPSVHLFPEITFIKFIKPGPDLNFIACSPFPATHRH